MSAPEEELVSALTGHAGLKALIDGRVSDWPLTEDETLPALTYYMTAAPRTQALDGSAHERRPQFTVNVWAKSSASRSAVTTQVVAALETVSGYVDVVDEGRDVPEPVTGLYRRDVDVRILR